MPLADKQQNALRANKHRSSSKDTPLVIFEDLNIDGKLYMQKERSKAQIVLPATNFGDRKGSLERGD